MILNKLQYGAINNKKIISFLLGIGIIGIIGGSIFITILSKSDQAMVNDYVKNFIKNIDNIDYISYIINSLLTHLIFIISIWVLGISIIGIPIIIFMYFSKLFTLGFSLSSFILVYKTKGLLMIIIYFIPHQLLNIGIYTLITLYAIKISNNLIYSIFNKKEVRFKKIMNKYIYILVVCLIGIIISVLYENIIMPILLNKLAFFLKI